MKKTLLKDTLGWGFVLWVTGYAAGIMLYPFVPIGVIGWIVLPLFLVVTLFVLLKKIPAHAPRDYILIGVIWMGIAIICDYLFLVQAFHPADGYYKFDVYLYYALTFFLPLFVGLLRKNNR